MILVNGASKDRQSKAVPADCLAAPRSYPGTGGAKSLALDGRRPGKVILFQRSLRSPRAAARPLGDPNPSFSNPMTQLATLKEVAEKLQVSTRTVQRLPIRFTRAGKQRRYDWADVERYLERRASRKRAAA